MDRRMIDADAALGHHFFEIPQAQSVGEILELHLRLPWPSDCFAVTHLAPARRLTPEKLPLSRPR